MPNPSVSLSGPFSSYPRPRVEIVNDINAGWTGTLTFPFHVGIDFGELETSVVTLNDGRGNSLTTPPMISRVRTLRDGVQGDWSMIQLIDQTSYRLSTGVLNFPTFLDGPVSQIVSAVGSACDVTITGSPTFPLWKEDVKQGDGWTVLRRIAAVDGKQLIVNTNGSLSFIDENYSAGGSHNFTPINSSREWHPADRFGKLFVSKALGTGSASPIQYYDFDEDDLDSQPVEVNMDSPLSFVNPLHVRSLGGFKWIAFWDAADNLISIHFFGDDTQSMPAATGSWPAVKFTGELAPARIDDTTLATDVRICLLGVLPDPLPSNIDAAFAKEYGSGRGWPHPFQENLVPSESFAAATWAKWLAEINRGTHTLSSTGLLDCGIRIGHSFSRFGKTGRVERIKWILGTSGAPTTEIKAEVA